MAEEAQLNRQIKESRERLGCLHVRWAMYEKIITMSPDEYSR
jgi:hypothetical protein